LSAEGATRQADMAIGCVGPSGLLLKGQLRGQ
jgi:hypothetical protein